MDFSTFPTTPVVDPFNFATDAADHTFQKAEEDWRRQADEAIERMVMEPDIAFKEADFRGALDTDRIKRIATNSAFMELQDGAPVADSESDTVRQMVRANVARTHFDGRGADSEDSFNTEVRNFYQGKRDRKDVAGKLAGEAAAGAILGDIDPANPKTWQATHEALKAMPGYDKDRVPDYFESFNQVQRDQREKAAPYKKALATIWNTWTGKDPSKSLAGAAEQAFYQTPPENRKDFMDALGTMARTLPEKERPEFFANLRKTTGQIWSDHARKIEEAGTSGGLATPTDSVVGIADLFGGTNKMAEEETGRLSAQANYREKRQFLGELSRIERNDFNPTEYLSDKDSFMRPLEAGLYATPGIVSTSLTMAIPVVGAASMTLAMEGDAYDTVYDRLSSGGMDKAKATEIAEGLSGLIALPQVALEQAQFGLWSRKLPFFSSAIDSLGDRLTNRAMRGVVRGTAIGAGETGIELLQDATSYAVQDIASALEQDIPGVKWRGESGALEGAWKSIPEMLPSMLVFGIMGAAGGHIADSQRVSQFQTISETQYTAFGGKPEDFAGFQAELAKGSGPGAVAIDRLMRSRDAASPLAVAAVEQLRTEMAEQKEAVQQAQASGLLPQFIPTPEGIRVIDGETGQEIGVAKDGRDAVRMAATHSEMVDENNADQVAFLATLIDFSATKADGKSQVNVDPFKKLSTTEEAALSQRDEARVMAQANANEALGRAPGMAEVVFGKSVTEFKQRVRETANKIYAGGTVLTVVHEDSHGFFREALERGRLTLDGTRDTIRQLQQGLEAGSHFLPAEGEVTETQIDEAVSELLEVLLLKNRKKEGAPPGLVSRNLSAFARISREGKALQGLVTTLREYFGQVFTRLYQLKKSIKDGKVKESDIDDFVSKLMGLNQQDEHNAAAEQEAGQILGESAASLGPAKMADVIADNATARIRDPKAKMKVFGGIVERMGRIKATVAKRGTAYNLDAFGKPYAPEAGFSSERKELLNALALWDGIRMALPPDVRGRFGSPVQLAKLTTPEKMLEFLERQVERGEKILDTHLSKEYRETLDEVVKRAQPKGKAGKKKKGHLGNETHRFFAYVEQVMNMSVEQVEAALKRVDEALLDATDPEELADLAEEYQILRMFGNFEDKTALEQHDALEIAQGVYETGRNQWKMVEQDRVEQTRERTRTAIKEAGGGDHRDLQATEAEERKFKNSLMEGKWSLRSFREVMELMFGADSATAKHFGNVVRRAFTGRTTAIIQVQREWKAAIEKATGQKGRRARNVVYNMTVKQSIQALVAPNRTHTIKIPIDTFFDAGARQSFGLTAEEIAQLTEQFEQLPENSRKQYLTVERQNTGDRAEARMAAFTESQVIHLSMLWAQESYKDALRKAGYGEEFQAEIEGKLSDAAKSLRAWLGDRYAAEGPALRALYSRMYGVSLSLSDNYAPGTFFSTGTDDTAIDPNSGVTAGGSFKEGFLRSRKKHTATPKAVNAFDVFFNHVNQTEHWKALAEVSREMHGVFGNPDLKIALQARSSMGAGAIQNWLKAIDANGIQMPTPSKLTQHLLTSQAYIAMSWKLTTAVKNGLGATINAAFAMPLPDYVRGMGRMMTGKIEFGEIWNSPMIQNRLAGGFSPEMRAVISKALLAKPSLRGDILLAGMEIHGKADAFGSAIGAAICYDYHFRQGRKAGLPESQARAIALDMAADAVSRTSQPTEVVDRSLYELGLGTWGKMMFLFASESRQKSSMYLTALGNTVTGKPTKKDLRVLFLAHFVMAPLMQAISAAGRDSQNDDDDEWFDEKYWNPRDFLKAVAVGPFAGIPLVRDVFSGFSGGNSPLDTYYRGGEALYDLFAEEPTGDEGEWYERKILQVLQATGAFPGVGGNIYKQFIGTGRNIEGTD